MQRCQYPGCPKPGAIIPVGPDLPAIDPARVTSVRGLVKSLREQGQQVYAVGVGCDEHRDLVRRRLMEEHQPRRAAHREGRGLP